MTNKSKRSFFNIPLLCLLLVPLFFLNAVECAIGGTGSGEGGNPGSSVVNRSASDGSPPPGSPRQLSPSGPLSRPSSRGSSERGVGLSPKDDDDEVAGGQSNAQPPTGSDYHLNPEEGREGSVSNLSNRSSSDAFNSRRVEKVDDDDNDGFADKPDSDDVPPHINSTLDADRDDDDGMGGGAAVAKVRDDEDEDFSPSGVREVTSDDDEPSYVGSLPRSASGGQSPPHLSATDDADDTDDNNADVIKRDRSGHFDGSGFGRVGSGNLGGSGRVGSGSLDGYGHLVDSDGDDDGFGSARSEADITDDPSPSGPPALSLPHHNSGVVGGVDSSVGKGLHSQPESPHSPGAGGGLKNVLLNKLSLPKALSSRGLLHQSGSSSPDKSPSSPTASSPHTGGAVALHKLASAVHKHSFGGGAKKDTSGHGGETKATSSHGGSSNSSPTAHLSPSPSKSASKSHDNALHAKATSDGEALKQYFAKIDAKHHHNSDAEILHAASEHLKKQKFIKCGGKEPTDMNKDVCEVFKKLHSDLQRWFEFAHTVLATKDFDPHVDKHLKQFAVRPNVQQASPHHGSSPPHPHAAAEALSDVMKRFDEMLKPGHNNKATVAPVWVNHKVCGFVRDLAKQKKAKEVLTKIFATEQQVLTGVHENFADAELKKKLAEYKEKAPAASWKWLDGVGEFFHNALQRKPSPPRNQHGAGHGVTGGNHGSGKHGHGAK